MQFRSRQGQRTKRRRTVNSSAPLCGTGKAKPQQAGIAHLQHFAAANTDPVAMFAVRRRGHLWALPERNEVGELSVQFAGRAFQAFLGTKLSPRPGRMSVSRGDRSKQNAALLKIALNEL